MLVKYAEFLTRNVIHISKLNKKNVSEYYKTMYVLRMRYSNTVLRPILVQPSQLDTHFLQSQPKHSFVIQN